MLRETGASEGRARGGLRVTLGAGLLAAVVVGGCGPDHLTAGSEEPRVEANGIEGAAAQAPRFRVTTVVNGLQNPWAVAFLPDGDLLITERAGRLRLVRGGTLLPQPVAGVPEVRAQGQGGLLDVALHPDFVNNRWVYLSYSKPGPRGATTAVARGRFDGERLVEVADIFVADAWGTGGQHFGSRLLFDRDGYLYVTVGDRGSPERAQNLADHAGTTLRLHDDGRAPADNPFVGRSGHRPEIFTYGNRNGQGLALHPQTGQVWQHEHGPRGGDEVNLLRPGRNYGWPMVSFGDQYDGRRIPNPTGQEGELALLHWTPSIAPSGMTFYTGDLFPAWRNNLFVGALAGQHLRRVVFDGTRAVQQESLLTDRNHRIRDVREGPDGMLYLLVDAARAPLLRIEPEP